MESGKESFVKILKRDNPLIAVPVGIIFKSPIFYKGKLRANRIETDMQISKMDERGITLDDFTWVPYSNISSISPRNSGQPSEKYQAFIGGRLAKADDRTNDSSKVAPQKI